MPAHRKGEEGYLPNRYKDKLKFALDLEDLEILIKRVRVNPRGKGEKPWLGTDPLRDQSLLSILFWSGLRIAEVVGDRPRKYNISRFSRGEQDAYRRDGVDWKTLDDPYIEKWTKSRKGILKEDMRVVRKSLFIIAEALKGGERPSPLELPVALPYVDLIVKQWERTKKKGTVWDLKTEYAWAILNEMELYPHHFRFTRATKLVANFRISPLHLKNWMGWKRLETAYNYLEKGGRYQKETGELLLEQYQKEEK